MEKWPGWLLAALYLGCSLLILIVTGIVNRFIVKPIVDALESSARKAVRRLVTVLREQTAPQPALRHIRMAAAPMSVAVTLWPADLTWKGAEMDVYNRPPRSDPPEMA